MKNLLLIPFLAILSQFYFDSHSIAKAAGRSQTAHSDSLQEYVGSYQFKDSGVFTAYTVTLKDGSLHGEADSYGVFKLVKKDKPDVFQSTSQYGSMITFKRNAETKKITGLSMFIQDTEMNAERQ